MILAVSGVAVFSVQLINRFCQGDEYGNPSFVRETVNEKYADEIHELRARYGLAPYLPEARGTLPKGLNKVILIHGLDDPGKVWMNLAPVLHAQGFDVWILTYPNDQPIRESAKFVFDQMAPLKMSHDENLAVVAHSMGGLVMREMLTSPLIQYAEQAADGRFPKISQLIMVGTPNHGSALAHFRVFSELREQVVHVFQGEYHWLLPFVDGAGEAGMDLLPKSAFLEDLNSRGCPKEIKMTVIAGIMSPMQQEDTRKNLDALVQGLSPENQAKVNGLMEKMNLLANEVGDGAVSVDSAKLPGIPLEMVSGNHLSIIRNVSPDSTRIPPAIPVILALLKEPHLP